MLVGERLLTDEGIFFPLFLLNFVTSRDFYSVIEDRTPNFFLIFITEPFTISARPSVGLSVHRSLTPIPIVRNVISVIG